MNLQPNIAYINELSGGDKNFESRILGILKMEFPVEKQEYITNLAESNFILAAENVHKLKHKINILGLNEAYVFAVDYENELRNQDVGRQDQFLTILNVMQEYLQNIA